LRQSKEAYEKSLYWIDFIEEAEDREKEHLKTAAYTNLGIVHDVSGEYETSLSYLNKALSLAKSQGDKVAEARIYENMGLAYTDRKDWDNAMKVRKNRWTFLLLE
jgi:tetratricopeptide (TPR) repeat protein